MKLKELIEKFSSEDNDATLSFVENIKKFCLAPRFTVRADAEQALIEELLSAMAIFNYDSTLILHASLSVSYPDTNHIKAFMESEDVKKMTNDEALGHYLRTYPNKVELSIIVL